MHVIVWSPTFWEENVLIANVYGFEPYLNAHYWHMHTKVLPFYGTVIYFVII